MALTLERTCSRALNKLRFLSLSLSLSLCLFRFLSLFFDIQSILSRDIESIDFWIINIKYILAEFYKTLLN